MKFEDIPRLTGNAVQFRRVVADPALPGNIVPCLMCGKPFIMPPFIGHPDQMCGECLRTYAGTPPFNSSTTESSSFCSLEST